MIARADALNLKHGIGDNLSGRGVLLLDGQVRQSLIDCGHADNAAALDVGLTDMNNYGLVVNRVAVRGERLHKGVHPGFDIAYRNLPVGVRRFRCDNLSVAENIENCARERIVGSVQFG